MGFVEGVGGKGLHLPKNLVGGGLLHPVLPAPLQKVGALLRHHVGLFLTHGPADQIGLAVAVAPQLPANLHHLLLVDDAAVGNLQNGAELFGEVGNVLRVMAAVNILGDRLHGAGAVEGDDGDNILEGGRLKLGNNPAHPSGFQLEHPAGLPGGEHLEHLWVVQRYLLDGEAWVLPPEHLFRVVNDGEVSQAQKVHLQKAQLLQGGHGVLGHHSFIIFRQGDIAFHRVMGDDHPGGMGAGVAGHPLHLLGQLHQLPDFGLHLHQIPQLLGAFNGLFQGDVQLHGDHLRRLVHLGIGNPQRTAHVPDGPAGRHGAKGDNLGHMVRPVLLHHVVDDLLAADAAEVDIKVRHTYPLRV